MFDPTAYENMKVVLEGVIYDHDLDGVISIIDRNDFINMAKLERNYEVTFTLKENSAIQCTIHLMAKLENLAAELRETAAENPLIGAHFFIQFNLNHEDRQEIHQKMAKELGAIWGAHRTIRQRVSYSPLEKTRLIQKEITVQFNRLIYEDQIDDLVFMMEYILVSIEKLEHILEQS